MDKKNFCDAISEDTLFDLMNEAEAYQNAVKGKKRKRSFVMKFAASVASIMMVVLTLNITSVTALVRNLFYVPGIGITENENLSSAVLDAPVAIQTDNGDFTIEFANKVRREDGRCEILLFLTSKEALTFSRNFSATAVIDGKEYDFPFNGGGNTRHGGSFTLLNKDFPDANEFDLIFSGTTTRISMSEASESEVLPHLSAEINGITLAAYKYRSNGDMIGIDIINNADNNIYFNFITSMVKIYDADGNKIKYGASSGSATRPYAKDEVGYNIVRFNDKEDKDIAKITQQEISVTYLYFPEDITTPKVTIPIPEDGQTLYTDIKIPVGGTVYEITEVRREGNVIYFEDNRLGEKLEDGGRSTTNFNRTKAVENEEIYVSHLYMNNPDKHITFNANENTIYGFNPDDESFELELSMITVNYFGDFTVTFD